MKNEFTKKEVLNAINKMAGQNEDFEYEVAEGRVITVEDIFDYVNKTVEQLENRNVKARERKSKADDTIKAIVAGVLTDENQTLAQLVAAIPAEVEDGKGKAVEVTPAKVVARLTALVKDGVAVKEEVKADGRKIMAYRLAVADADVDVEDDAE